MARRSTRKTTNKTGRGRRGSGKPGGPQGLLNQVTGRFGRSSSRGSNKRASIGSNVSGFVRGLLGGGTSGRRRR